MCTSSGSREVRLADKRNQQHSETLPVVHGRCTLARNGNQLLFCSNIIEQQLIEIQRVGPKRELKLSYRALVRCKRIATTSPIQWRQRELPGGARKQS